MDTQAEKTRHTAAGPDEWDGPSKKNPHIHFFFFFCTAMCWTHRSPDECWEIQGKDSGKETPQQGNLSKPCRPQLTPSSALSVRRHNADEAFEFTRHFSF